MAKNKIQITITLQEGKKKPKKHTKKEKKKKAVRIGKYGDYGIVDIFNEGELKNIFSIQLPLIDSVKIK